MLNGDNFEAYVLIPTKVQIPLSKMEHLVRNTQDRVAAFTGMPEGTPQIMLEDVIYQAIADGVISIHEDWELPHNSNRVIDPSEYRKARR